jgi:hypothetical protein
MAFGKEKAKLMLFDFTASKQNAVQHPGKEQPSVCRDEHLSDHLHCQPEPADARLQTGVLALSSWSPTEPQGWVSHGLAAY